MRRPGGRGDERPVVVVGEAMLDIDLVGSAERLSPDAPVPVLDDLRECPRPGGAALAAMMAARDGLPVALVTPLADDEPAARLLHLLEPAVAVFRLPAEGGTPVKTRVRSAGQTLVRLDRGGVAGTFADLPPDVVELLGGARAVLVADYGRGLTGNATLRDSLAAFAARAPLVWDPHPRGAAPVAGARLVTPNRSELLGWAPTRSSAGAAADRSLASITRCAAAARQAWQAHAVAVTLGSDGALLTYGDGAPAAFPAVAVSDADTCGAGDQFAAKVVVELALGALPSDAVGAAVAAATAHVASGGAAQVELRQPGAGPLADDWTVSATALAERVRARGGVVVATGGCFDLLHAGHVASLHAARQLGDCLVVCLNSDSSVRRLKGPARPLVPMEDRARVLQALECVDAVQVFDEDTPHQVLRELRPHVWAKGGDYAGDALPESTVLREWDGQAVLLPYLQGRSTSALVRTAATSASSPSPRQPEGSSR